MAKRPEKTFDITEVKYTAEQWMLLSRYREKAAKLLEALERFHLQAIVHGSIARGDVNLQSDIDVFTSSPASSFQMETALQAANLHPLSRYVIQATPSYAMKAYLELDTATTVSFPLMRMRRVELEFYKFSGETNLVQLRQNLRVAGVDKRLMLIEPLPSGHVESSIVGRENFVAKKLGIAVETVLDRVHALIKRDSVGRTGVFLKRQLFSDETFELVLKKLADENPAVRRRLRM